LQAQRLSDSPVQAIAQRSCLASAKVRSNPV
jgi:hypothetical protein